MDNDNRWWDEGRNDCPVVPGLGDNASTCREQDDNAGI